MINLESILYEKIDVNLLDLSETKGNIINNYIKNEIKNGDEMSIISEDNLNNSFDNLFFKLKIIILFFHTFE